MARRRDGFLAKVLVVALVGGAAFGVASLRARLTAGPPAHAERAPRVLVDPLAKARVAIDSAAEPRRGAPRGPRDRTALLEAAARGDTAGVEALHRSGVALDGALEAAAPSANLELVRWLLDHGVSVKEGAGLPVPPLLLADASAELATFLLAHGADEVPLDKAVAAGAPNAVKRVLAKGASAKTTAKDAEPLLVLAVRSAEGERRRAVVEALLGAGAPPDAKTEKNETALDVVVAQALEDRSDDGKVGEDAWSIATLLLARGARTTADSLTKVAREKSHEPWLRALLAAKLAPDATIVAVTDAAIRGDAELVTKLAARGVAWTRAGETSALLPLERAIVDEHLDVVRALLAAGAPMEDRRVTGNTALVTAVTAAAGGSETSLEIVRVLLDRGASPNARGIEGTTPLFAAAQQGSTMLVTLLVSRGARVDDPVSGMTPREAADLAGHDDVVKLLVLRGARAPRPRT